MRSDLQEQLEANIDCLIDIVRETDSRDLLNTTADALTYTGQDIFQKTGLSSPFRQHFYLLGLMVSNPTTKIRPLSNKRWNEVYGLLERIFSLYSLMFFPTKEDLESQPPKWWEARKVVMPMFLDYFCTGLVAWDEQVIGRIGVWFRPYDQTIQALTGLSTDDLLGIYKWCEEKIQEQACALFQAVKEEKRTRLIFLKRCEKEGWSPSVARNNAQNDSWKMADENLRGLRHSLFVFQKAEMRAAFGDGVVQGLWNHLVSQRTHRDFRYISQENPALARPLFSIAPNEIYCPCLGQFARAVLEFLLKTMRGSPKAKSFLGRRHREVVNSAAEILSTYFGKEAVVLKSVFETPDAQFEHDIVVLYKRNMLTVEAKASPRKAPFRNPDKAYIRMKRAFASDTGIQKSCDQCLGLKRHILNSSYAVLYDNRGGIVETVRANDYDSIHSICLTAEGYGIVAINLSLLLEKPSDEPFPWSCNLYDLETLLDGFKFKGHSGDFFLRYLDERARFHEKFFASDELEIAGFYLQHGSFGQLENKQADLFVFTPDMSNIFDDIYFRKHGSRFLPYDEDSKPTFMNLRGEIAKMIHGHKEKGLGYPTPGEKIGRNKPCSCGSGRKYKHCHGRPRP